MSKFTAEQLEESALSSALSALKAKEAPQIPEGYFTPSEWAKREGRPLQCVERGFRKLAAAGLAERRDIVTNGHLRSYYKLKA